MQQLADGARDLGIPLTDDQLEAFQVYYETLIDWNSRVNLTRITDYEAVQVKHFLDSLSCLPVIEQVSADAGWVSGASPRTIDVGAGAGFPGVPLKIAMPRLRLALLEATGKKAEFLRYLVGRLGLADVSVSKARAEEAGQDPAHRAGYDLALARALIRFFRDELRDNLEAGARRHREQFSWSEVVNALQRLSTVPRVSVEPS